MSTKMNYEVYRDVCFVHVHCAVRIVYLQMRALIYMHALVSFSQCTWWENFGEGQLFPTTVLKW